MGPNQIAFPLSQATLSRPTCSTNSILANYGFVNYDQFVNPIDQCDHTFWAGGCLPRKPHRCHTPLQPWLHPAWTHQPATSPAASSWAPRHQSAPGCPVGGGGRGGTPVPSGLIPRIPCWHAVLAISRTQSHTKTSFHKRAKLRKCREGRGRGQELTLSIRNRASSGSSTVCRSEWVWPCSDHTLPWRRR